MTEFARGRPLATIARDLGIDPSTLYRHATKTPERLQAYLLARECCADSLAAEVLEIVDTDPDPARANNRASARKWLASKLAPRTYGERLDVSLSAPIDLGAALSEARARAMRPISDQARVIDAQVVDSDGVSQSSATDKESGALVPDDAENSQSSAEKEGNVDIYQ